MDNRLRTLIADRPEPRALWLLYIIEGLEQAAALHAGEICGTERQAAPCGAAQPERRRDTVLSTTSIAEELRELYRRLRRWLDDAYSDGVFERQGWCRHGRDRAHRACWGPFDRPEPYAQELEQIAAGIERLMKVDDDGDA